jgi:hypothetical protein
MKGDKMRDYEGVYLGAQPVLGQTKWKITIQLDTGEIKNEIDNFREIKQCIDTLDLKKGDRIRVRRNKEWVVDKLDKKL